MKLVIRNALIILAILGLLSPIVFGKNNKTFSVMNVDSTTEKTSTKYGSVKSSYERMNFETK